MYNINPNDEQAIRKAALSRGVADRVRFKHGQQYRTSYIQFFRNGRPENIHYEYYVCKWKDYRKGYISLHFEPEKGELKHFSRLSGLLARQLKCHPEVTTASRCNLNHGEFRLECDEDIGSWETMLDRLKELEALIEPLLQEGEQQVAIGTLLASPYHEPHREAVEEVEWADKEVDVKCLSLDCIMHLNLHIPPYQRDYCWEDEQILTLWKDLKEMEEGVPFHLGTIICQHKQPGKEYNLIDGQQRLVTLTLFLRALGYATLPLLKETFRSARSQTYIANAKYIIQTLVERLSADRSLLAEKIASSVCFSVLALQSNNLDLAFTFFSNQNNRGMPLTDYDLLKAHHLRYMPNEKEAEHLATRWNRMLQSDAGKTEPGDLAMTLGSHIYRLRKWMRKRYGQEGRYRYVQHEYQAAALLEEVPAFAQSFDFYEKIQGGAHFFAFADHFVAQYRIFKSERTAQLLHEYLGWQSHQRYAEVIETMLFGYFLKFGNNYLTEMLYCICALMSLHRFNRRAAIGVKEFACDTEVVQMIDQASSPTFCMAETLDKVEKLAGSEGFPIRNGSELEWATGVKWQFYTALQCIFRKLTDTVTIHQIANRINQDYEL